MRKGFTLIELLLGTALFALVFSAAGVVLFSSLKGSRKAAAVAVAKSEGAYTLRAITDMVRYAERVQCHTDRMQLYVKRTNGDELVYSFEDMVAPDPDKIASTSGSFTVPGPIAADLTSNRVNVTLPAGDCGGVMFTCDTANKTVGVCFMVDNVAGVDVTDRSMGTEGVLFRSQVLVLNEVGN